MTLILSGTNGVSDIDGDASTPAVRGTDANSGIFFGADTVGVSTGGSEKVSVGASAVVVNDGGADVDFRVEGDTDANLLFVDASSDSILMGTATPSTGSTFGAARLEIVDGGTFAGISVSNTVSNSNNKVGHYTGRHYTNAEENVLGLRILSLAASNTVEIGGGSASLNAATEITFSTAANNTTLTGTERMRIDSSGNVGIGTSSPTGGKLHIEHGNEFGIYTSSSFNFQAKFESTDSEAGIVIEDNNSTNDGNRIGVIGDNMAFTTANSERMRIESGGNVTIGSTANLAKLAVVQTSASAVCIRAENNQASVSSAANIWSTLTGGSNNNTTAIHFAGYTETGNKFIVYGNGDVVNTNNSYGAISDVKLKQDIVDAGSQWDDLKAIRIRKFRFKSDPNGVLQIGVIAQELEEISPGLVSEHTDHEMVEVPVLDDDGNPVLDEEGNPTTRQEQQATGETTKSVKATVLYMKAVKALQEAMERIETLEASNTALEARIAVLEGN